MYQQLSPDDALEFWIAYVRDITHFSDKDATTYCKLGMHNFALIHHDILNKTIGQGCAVCKLAPWTSFLRQIFDQILFDTFIYLKENGRVQNDL